MSEKQMSARVMNLCLTEAEWSTNYANFIPKKGELVIYDSDSTNTVRRFKFGDGIKTVNELPFQDTNISNSKSGSTIQIDDVSPITHDMGVKVKSKNLIPYPYAETTKTQNGITFTDNGDGTITANGTATNLTDFILAYNYQIRKGMLISGAPDGQSDSTFEIQAYLDANNIMSSVSGLASKKDFIAPNIRIRIRSGATLNNVVFKPQIELGTTATDYTPYVPDLTAVKVTRCGKNLFDKDMSFTDENYLPNQKYNSTYFIQLLPNTTYYVKTFNPLEPSYVGYTFINNSPDVASSVSTAVCVSGNYSTAENDWHIENYITTDNSGKLYIGNNRSLVNLKKAVQEANIQIELGTTATYYEPYKGADYTPNADGTVEGVTSIYPNTTLLTDTDGIYIDCEYLTNNYKSVLDNRIPKQVQSANKLTTPRSISITGGVNSTATNFDGSQNISIPITSIKESYLSWGGKNFLASFGPLDAAMIPELNANRFAFMNTSAIEVQYSIDGGNTWSTYNDTDNNLNTLKSNLFNGNLSGLYIGGSNSTNIDKSNHQLRIIITTDIAKLYTSLNKFCIYCSTGGSNGSWCTIDAKTHSDVVSNSDVWTVFADRVSIGGWSGYNIINTAGFTTYSNTDSQYQKIRFTFGVTSHPSTTGYAGLCISKIMGFGGVGWQTPSEMAKTGRMYTYDSGGNVTFPAGLTAKAFNGSLSGNAESATKLKNTRNIKINLSSTNGVNFDGTSDVTPGVTGTLGIANGGTGATTVAGARSNLGLVAITNDEIDSICV